jgi:hypothetical protein
VSDDNIVALRELIISQLGIPKTSEVLIEDGGSLDMSHLLNIPVPDLRTFL